ncbi:MAG: glycosyltransferase family 2 protein [Cytophagaceae bacterium]|nr:glycosyltransferase family 2 protein [Cytophagaceae bacterium]
MKANNHILLSITIPTYNRAEILRKNLQQLFSQIDYEILNEVEIIVSDNCSTDNTEEIILPFKNSNINFTYIKNHQNLGWGLNFFQCFNMAKGKYIIILSDDDLIFDGKLDFILKLIKVKEYGVICLRAFGFSENYKDEYPGERGGIYEFSDFNSFLRKAFPQFTLLSSTIINKSIIQDFNTNDINPGNFAHLHLILECSSHSKLNAYVDNYIIAVQRDNSSNYSYSKVFVSELWKLLYDYSRLGISTKTLEYLERKMLLTHYPFDLLRIRLHKTKMLKECKEDFQKKFDSNKIYIFFVRPILTLPKYLAISWSLIIILINKLLKGETKSLLFIAKKFLLKKIS